MDQGATPDVVSALVKSRYCLLRSVHPHAASDSFSLRDVASIRIHRTAGQEIRVSVKSGLMHFCNMCRRTDWPAAGSQGGTEQLHGALIGFSFKSNL